MSRPTKYSPATAERILDALKAGNTRTASALFVGITYTTLKTWAQRNLEFSAALDQAEAQAEVRCVASLAKAVQEGDTAAAKWWLERRRSDDWRERKSTDIAVTGPIEVKHGVDDASAQLLADLIAAGLAHSHARTAAPGG